MRNLLVILLVVLVAACDGQQTPTEPSIPSRARIREPLTLSGKVLDFASGVGVSDAMVAFVDESDGSRATTVTDTGGSYTLSLPRIGAHTLFVDGRLLGSGRITGSSYRGDLLVDRGTCMSRYGILADARTGRPIVGATLTLFETSVRSATDGWYQLDLGCPTDRLPGECPSGGTIAISIVHPDYGSRFQVIGRGAPCNVFRLDVVLERR